MTPIERFYKLRAEVIRTVNLIRASGEPGKSYEGCFELQYRFPDASDCWDGIINKPDNVNIVLHCYLLGPARHYEWSGTSLSEALDKCEAEVLPWVREELRALDED